MMYAFITDRCADLPVDSCCRALKMSRSAFYTWRHQQSNPTARMRADVELSDLVAKIHEQSFGVYGVLRVTAELRLGLGRQVNHKRVQRLMRERGLHGVTRRRRRTTGCTRTRPDDVRSDDLVHRQFRPDGPDRLWVQDITQHRTGEGWVYLAVVIDAWSRRVVGWSIADHLRAELVVDAIDMATMRRRPTGTTAHSDHGSQYCSWVFGQRLRTAGLMGSMGSVGDALDNAVAESFFASLQCELLDRHNWPTRAGLARALFHWIEAFYNPTRRHSTLGYLSPIDFETTTVA
jgi:putative transposase